MRDAKALKDYLRDDFGTTLLTVLSIGDLYSVVTPQSYPGSDWADLMFYTRDFAGPDNPYVVGFKACFHLRYHLREQRFGEGRSENAKAIRHEGWEQEILEYLWTNPPKAYPITENVK